MKESPGMFANAQVHQTLLCENKYKYLPYKEAVYDNVDISTKYMLFHAIAPFVIDSMEGLLYLHIKEFSALINHNYLDM